MNKSLIDMLFPQLNATAVSATNTALNTAAARPFSVVLSVDSETKVWISVMVALALVAIVKTK